MQHLVLVPEVQEQELSAVAEHRRRLSNLELAAPRRCDVHKSHFILSSESESQGGCHAPAEVAEHVE